MPARYDPHKHHRRSIRLQGYDYTQPGTYFITIATYLHTELFGEIVNAEMHLNFLGGIAREEWARLPFRFPCLRCGAYVVMPNHIHGLLMIADGKTPDWETVKNRNRPGFSPNQSCSEDAQTTEQFGKPIHGSIPTIVRSYKSSVVNRIRLLREPPDHPIWQRNYYEHVVRDDADLERIERYILDNPGRWDEDQLNLHHSHR